MIVSRDLDCSNTLYIQFAFKFITKGTNVAAYFHMALAMTRKSFFFVGLLMPCCMLGVF